MWSPALRFGWDDWETRSCCATISEKRAALAPECGARATRTPRVRGALASVRPAAPQQAWPARRPAAAGHSGNVVSLCFALSWRRLRRLAGAPRSHVPRESCVRSLLTVHLMVQLSLRMRPPQCEISKGTYLGFAFNCVRGHRHVPRTRDLPSPAGPRLRCTTAARGGAACTCVRAPNAI